MSVLCQRPQKRKKKIKEGINFILNHFHKHDVFPRAVSTQALPGESPIIIHDENEMFRAYERSGFIDCRVSVYSAFTTEKFIHHNGINIHAPDFIFINLTSKYSSLSSPLPTSPTILSCNAGNGLVDQAKELFSILQNIKDLLYEARPTILWTGNGFQVYQPVKTITLEDMEEEYIDLEYLEEFRKFVSRQQVLSNLFLEFLKQRLLSYNNTTRLYSLYYQLYKSSSSSSSSHPPHSFFLDPSMLMIPGTLNSECIVDSKEQEVEIAQVWDGNRPKVDLLLADFQGYLIDRKNTKEKR